MNNFNKFNNMLDLDALRAVCMENGEVVKFKKGECFAHAGEILTRFGIVNRGLFGHMTYSSDGIAHITGFSFEDSVVSNYLSLMTDEAMPVDIVALSDTEAMVCDRRFIKDIIDANVDDKLKLAESLFKEIYLRYLSLYNLTPRERYQALLQQCPNLLQFITLKQLASFLQVTPTHLSRIRKELLES